MPRSSCWKFVLRPKEFYSDLKSSSKSKLGSFWFQWEWNKLGVQSKYSKWRGLVSSMTKLQKLLRFCTIFKLVKEKIKCISLNASPTQNRGSQIGLHCKLKKRPPVTPPHRFHDVSLRSPCVCSFVRRIECEICRQIDTRHFYYPAATSIICHLGRVLYSTISTNTKFYFLVLLLLALLDLCYFC